MPKYSDHFLKTMMKETNGILLDASSAINYVESSYINTVIESGYFSEVNIKEVLEQLLGKTIKCLCVLPCSSYIDKIITPLQKYFDNLLICDNYKTGNVVNGLRIINQKQLEETNVDIDAYFIITRDKSIQDIFLKKLPENKIILIDQIEAARINSLSDIMMSRMDNLIDKIRQCKNPLLMFGGRYYNNYSPIDLALQAKGYDVFIISRSYDVSHATLNPCFNKLQFSNKYVLNYVEMCYFIAKIDKGVIVVNSESFLNSGSDAIKNIASYLYPLTIFKINKLPKIIYLYDLMRMFFKNLEYTNDLEHIYKKLLRASDGIILSANTDEATEFLQCSLNITKPIMYFPRYNTYSNTLKETRNDGFHIVILGIFLNESNEKIRDLRESFRILLKNRIHLHYYVSNINAKIFVDTLPDTEKTYFHMHNPILDQNKLIFEISQYHAGWMVHNTQEFVNIIGKIDNQYIKDLIYMYKLTTVPSAILAFGSAGLPMFINRSMQGIIKTFPSQYFLPMELSEISNISQKVKNTNWQELTKYTRKYREVFSIDFNISELLDFISKVCNAASGSKESSALLKVNEKY